jgi:membrane-associated phospholipid phosphatase
MYVGAHYLSDVVCAAVLGILCADVVWRFFQPHWPWATPKIEENEQEQEQEQGF